MTMQTLCTLAPPAFPPDPIVSALPPIEKRDCRLRLRQGVGSTSCRLEVVVGGHDLLLAWRGEHLPEPLGSSLHRDRQPTAIGVFVVVPASGSWYATGFKEAFSNMIVLPLESGMPLHLPATSVGWMDRILEVSLNVLRDGACLTTSTRMAARELAENHLQTLLEQGCARPVPMERGGLAPWQLRKVLRHIEVHATERVTVGDLAGLVGLSVKHFAKAFKATTGETPYRRLLRQRIDRSKTLLLEGRSLAVVALRCGFSDQSHFSGVFRQFEGVPPGLWRRLVDEDAGPSVDGLPSVA